MLRVYGFRSETGPEYGSEENVTDPNITKNFRIFVRSKLSEGTNVGKEMF